MGSFQLLSSVGTKNKLAKGLKPEYNIASSLPHPIRTIYTFSQGIQFLQVLPEAIHCETVWIVCYHGAFLQNINMHSIWLLVCKIKVPWKKGSIQYTFLIIHTCMCMHGEFQTTPYCVVSWYNLYSSNSWCLWRHAYNSFNANFPFQFSDKSMYWWLWWHKQANEWFNSSQQIINGLKI